MSTERHNLLLNPFPRSGGAIWKAGPWAAPPTLSYDPGGLKIMSPAGSNDCFAYAEPTLPAGDYVFAAWLNYATGNTFESNLNRALLACGGNAPGQYIIAQTDYQGLNRLYTCPFTLTKEETVYLRLQARKTTESGLSVTWKQVICVTAEDWKHLQTRGLTYFDGDTYK